MSGAPFRVGFNIRALTEADLEAFWRVRLRALRDHPQAFASSYEEARAMPFEAVAQLARSSPRA